MKLYAAQIEILIPANSEAEACDTVSEAFTNNLVLNGVFKDWQYISPKRSPMEPISEEDAQERFVDYTG